ncbi:MAG: hypothetical protein ACKN9T_07730 [Candidatus Methylumidiphilus sp.]
MFAYKETMVIDDPQRLVLKTPLPLRKGQKIEIIVTAETDDELEQIRDGLTARGIVEDDVRDAIAWARSDDSRHF